MNDMMALLPDIKLRFNIEHPSLEDCYAYGYECAVAEVNEEENPYAVGSKESLHWIEGWWAGFYGEKALHEFADESLNQIDSANDGVYHENFFGYFVTVLEITGIIAVSAAVGIQLFELVA